MSAWKEIGSAPRDGTECLVYDQGAFVAAYYESSGWTATLPGDHFLRPTHWMPLPPPPAPSADGGR